MTTAIDWTGINLEVCSNTEHLGWDVGGTPLLAEDAQRIFYSHVDRELSSIGLDWSQHNSARGQRATFHGWNGAHFTHRGTGWGTFFELSPEQDRAVDEAMCRAYDATVRELEGIDQARVVIVPDTGREIRRTADGRWECQPWNDNYWRTFDDLLDAAKFASKPRAVDYRYTIEIDRMCHEMHADELLEYDVESLTFEGTMDLPNKVEYCRVGDVKIYRQPR